MRRECLAGALQEPVAARNQERADEHCIDQNPDYQCKAELAKGSKRAEEKRREATGRDHRGRADQAPGLTDRPDDAVAQSSLLRLFVQPRHKEDVVIHPHGDQEDEQEVRDLPIEPLSAQHRDEHEVGRAQGEGIGQDHRRHQVQACQGITQRDDQDEEDTDGHDEPALDLVVVGK